MSKLHEGILHAWWNEEVADAREYFDGIERATAISACAGQILRRIQTVRELKEPEPGTGGLVVS